MGGGGWLQKLDRVVVIDVHVGVTVGCFTVVVLPGTSADAGACKESSPAWEVASWGGLPVLRLCCPPVFPVTSGPLVRHHGGGQPKKTHSFTCGKSCSSPFRTDTSLIQTSHMMTANPTSANGRVTNNQSG